MNNEQIIRKFENGAPKSGEYSVAGPGRDCLRTGHYTFP